jgi:hypothetical protein
MIPSRKKVKITVSDDVAVTIAPDAVADFLDSFAGFGAKQQPT